MSKRYIFIALVLLLTAAGVHAAPPSQDLDAVLFPAAGISRADVEAARVKGTKSLFDLYSLAVACTERMAIEGENSVQAEAHRSAAFGSFLPQLRFSASKVYPTANRGSGFSPSSTAAFYAQQNIMTGLTEISQYRKAGAEIRMREYSLRDAAGQLLFDVAAAHMNLVRVTKTIRNKEKIRENYRGIENELKKRVAIGRSRPSELLQIQSQIYLLNAQIDSAGNTLRQAQNVLSYLTGIPLPIAVAEEFSENPSPLLEADPSGLAVSRFDVKAAQESVNMASAGLAAAYGGFAPELNVTAGDRIYQETMKGHDYYVGLNATMPLFSGGQTLSAVKEASSLVRQAELALSQTKRKAAQEITDAASDYRSTLHQIDSYRKALDAAEMNYRTLLDEYRLKLVTVVDVLTSLTNLETARDAYEGIVIDHAFSRISFGIASGELAGPGAEKLREANVPKGEGK